MAPIADAASSGIDGLPAAHNADSVSGQQRCRWTTFRAQSVRLWLALTARRALSAA
jgi:hypothetical protein